MKKLNKKKRIFESNRQEIKFLAGKRLANRRKHFTLKRKIFKIVNRDLIEELLLRTALYKNIYKKKHYKNESNTIPINGDFGLEDGDIEGFLNTASSIIDFDCKKLKFDLQKCTRMWPSAITLFCSLMQWTELKSGKYSRAQISSSNSNSKKVNSYLGYCGFYDYVKRQKDNIDGYYDEKEIVKIKRETKKANIEKREDEIILLLEKYSEFTKDEISLFDSVVLTEVFNNVTEHGVSNRDQGWWLLAQYHPTHEIITLCIADNGIGIRNSLMTGPQRKELTIENIPKNEGEFISLALNENISGAMTASIKNEGRIFKRYERGERRGNGLNRIFGTCKELKISFAILSHHGYIMIGDDGNVQKVGSKPGRVFAGTLYHFIIKAKGSFK